MGRRLALLIATYEHQDPGLRRLTAPAHDAEALAEVLRDPDIAGFEVDILINEPHYRVGEAIGDLYRDRRRDDLALLYFTGHGLKDEEGRLHLAMANTRRDNLAFTSLPAEQVDRAMKGCMSRQQVLILDCCYSGAFPAGRLAKADADMHTLERFQGRGRTVLTASDATQYSFEGDQVHGRAAQSVFTRFLAHGLRDGSADLDGDGDITLDELYAYVHDKVVDEMPQQRPKKQDNVEGRIVIARNVNWTLPGHLQHALSSPIATDRLGAVEGLTHLYRVGNERVRRRAAAELQLLSDDDSRAVSSTATAHLECLLAPDPTIPPPSTVESETPSGEVHQPKENRHATASSPASPLQTPGTLRWRFPMGSSVIPTPVVANEVVYVGSGDGNLYAIDTTTGEKRWQFTTNGPVYSRPAVAEGVVYLGSDDRNLYAIDTTTGEKRWQFTANGPVRSLPVVAGGVVYTGDCINYVYAIDAATGEKIWQHTAGWSQMLWLVAAGGMVYVGNTGRSMYAIDAAAGERRWRSPISTPAFSSPPVTAGLLYVGSEDHHLHAIDAATGAKRWQFATGGPIRRPPAVADGLVYVGSDDRHLYAIDAVTGEKKWQFLTGGCLKSSPTVADGLVYVGSDDHRLYAIDAATGEEGWQFTTGGAVHSPAVADRLVCVSSDDHHLYAVNAGTSAP